MMHASSGRRFGAGYFSTRHAVLFPFRHLQIVAILHAGMESDGTREQGMAVHLY
jgi:hypothetical protein